MENHLKILLREGINQHILVENKLYGKKVVEPLLNKIGDSSEETLNKIAIAGLFRNKFSPIQAIKSKLQLDTEFGEWYKGVIETLTSGTKAFVDNDELAKKYLDGYVNNIKSLGVNAKPFSTKQIEKTFVDVVNNNSWIEKSSGLPKQHNIYNPMEGDIMYEDDEILVLNSSTKAKCVMYGENESWCIGDLDANYYNSYRLNDGATPYHILQKKFDKDHVEHKLVIMNYGPSSGDEYDEDYDEDYDDGINVYAIADRDNTERGGSKDSAVEWSSIVSEIPNLRGLEEHLEYRPITHDEKIYNDLLERAKKFDGDDFLGYINGEIKGLKVDGSPMRAKDFVRDYASMDGSFTKPQLKSLGEEEIDSLIEAGYFWGEKTIKENFDILTDRQKRRVLNIKIKNGHELTDGLFDMATEEQKEEYIKTRIEGKRTLTEAQFNNLNDEVKVRYIDYRSKTKISMAGPAKPFELKLFSEEQKNTHLTNVVDDNSGFRVIERELYNSLSLSLKIKYLRKRVDVNYDRLEDYEFADLTDELKDMRLKKMIESRKEITDIEYKQLNLEFKELYIKNIDIVSTHSRTKMLSDQKYIDTPDELKEIYIDKIIKEWGGYHKNTSLLDQQYTNTPDELKLKYLKALTDLKDKTYQSRKDGEVDFSLNMYINTPDDVKVKFFDMVLNTRHFSLTDEFFEVTSDTLKLTYLKLKVKGKHYITASEYKILPYELKEIVIEIYETRKMDMEKYSFTPDKLKLKYIQKMINNGDSLYTDMLLATPDKIKLYYFKNVVKMRLEKGEEINDSEYQYFPDNFKKIYIQNGGKLTHKTYQETPNELKKLYVKIRHEGGKNLDSYHMGAATDEIRSQRLEKNMKDFNISDDDFMEFSDKEKWDYYISLFNHIKNESISHPKRRQLGYLFEYLPDNLKIKFIEIRIDSEDFGSIHKDEYGIMPDNLKLKLLFRKVDDGYGVHWDWERKFFNDLPDKYKSAYYSTLSKIGKIDAKEFNGASDEDKLTQINYKLNNSYLNGVEFENAPPELRVLAVKDKIENGNYLNDFSYNLLPANTQLQYLMKRKETGSFDGEEEKRFEKLNQQGSVNEIKLAFRKTILKIN